MRALRTERLLAFSEQARGMVANRAAPKGAPARRRKPPPRWRKPVLSLGVAVILATASAAGAYLLWQAGYPRSALTWAERTAERWQIAAGLTVDEVILWGRERTPRDEVLRALAVRRGQLIMSVDPGAARARLEEIGWVESAEVARRLPAKLEVRIVERVPLALWQREGELALIGRDGVVITDKELERFRNLPIVVGRGGRARAAALLTVLRREPALFRRLEAAVLVGGRRWNLRLAGGIEVRLPEGGEAGAWARLAALEKEHKILERHLVAIDMRLPDRLVVRLAPGSAWRFRGPGEKT